MLANQLYKLARFRCMKNFNQVRFVQKNFHPLGSDSGGYAGDGKTTVKVINDEDTGLNLITAYSRVGFRLANKLRVTGSVLIFPTCIYSWNIQKGIDITPESLVVFDLIVPKIKILIIGYGQHGEPYNPNLVTHMRKRGISCEILPTPHACTTYNYLVHDSVHVAAALVPVKDSPKTRLVDTLVDSYSQGYEPNEWLPMSGHMRDPPEHYAKYRPKIEGDKDKKKFD